MLTLLAVGVVLIGIYAVFNFSSDTGVARANDYPNGFAYSPVTARDFDPLK